jgi:hypothetical protein
MFKSIVVGMCSIASLVACSGSPVEVVRENTSPSQTDGGTTTPPAPTTTATSPSCGSTPPPAQDAGPIPPVCGPVCQYNQCVKDTCNAVPAPPDPVTGQPEHWPTCGKISGACNQTDPIVCGGGDGTCDYGDKCGDSTANRCSHVCRAAYDQDPANPPTICQQAFPNHDPGFPVWQAPADCLNASRLWRYGVNSQKYGNEDPGKKYVPNWPNDGGTVADYTTPSGEHVVCVWSSPVLARDQE